MLRAAVIQHLAFEDLGTLRPALLDAGFQIDVFEAWVSDLTTLARSSPALLVVLGGPIGVYERENFPFLQHEIDLITERTRQDQPTLGICLGSQLIAASLDANVYAGERGKEIGWGALTRGPQAPSAPYLEHLFAPGVQVLHWHGDSFDLPIGARHLAQTAQYPQQAFAVGRHTLALQFHPEVSADALERWYIGHRCELQLAGIDIRTLRERGRIHAPVLERAANRLWRDWLGTLI